MLYLLFSVLIILPVFTGFGGLLRKFVGGLYTGFSADLILGILAITIIWSVLVFFIPLGFWVELITVLLGFFLFFYYKAYFPLATLGSRNRYLVILFGLISLFFASFAPYILDHFGYFVPSILWLSQEGLPRGISNLDLILGQSSIWHILQAGFSHFSDVYLRLNAVVILLFILYIFEKKSWFSLLFLPIFYLFAQQPSPDLPVMVFSLLILNEVLLGNKNFGFLLFFSVFVFAIKPTIIWLPIFVFGYIIFQKRLCYRTLFPAFLLLLGYFFKNIWAFGYPIFPVQVLDFCFFWKPNADILQNSAQLAIEKTYDLQYTYSQISKFTLAEHIINWFTLEGIKGKIHILFILELIVLGGYAVFKKSKMITLLFVAILIKSILMLLFSAQYRFFLEVFLVVPFVLFWEKFKPIKMMVLSIGISIIIALLMIFPSFLQTHLPSFNLGFAMKPFEPQQIIKPADYQYQKFRTYQIGNLRFFVVKDYPFSFDTPLPAISPGFILEYYRAGIFPQMLGTHLKDGFVWRKLSPSEKEKVEFILNDLKIEFQKVR